MASYNAVMHEVHVLLVDHDTNCLVNTARLLETCHYRVTFVEFSSAAITMLLSGKMKFDIVMAAMDSSDLHGFELLQHAVNLDLPIISMSIDDNAFSVMRALENGAFLQIKKPPSIDVVKCLWQHVLREKTRKIRQRDPFFGANFGTRGVQIREAINRREEIMSPNYGGGLNYMGMTSTTKNKGKSTKKSRERTGVDYEEEFHQEFENYRANSSKAKRKACTEWTKELHSKFLNAVQQLGEGRCFPKEILELMKVPGLTRMQVASHLQKCRNENWRTPEERKTQSNQTIQDTEPSPSSNPRKFGSMPRLGKSGSLTPVLVRVQDTNGQDSGTPTQNESMPNGSGQQDIGTELVATNTSNRHWPLGSMGAGPSNPTHCANSSSNNRHDLEFFQFQDIDSMIRNLSGLPQDPGVNNLNPAPVAYRLNQTYTDHQQQNYGDPSTDSRKERNSEMPNDGSDDFGTRGN